MNNIQTVGALLRAIESSTGSLLAPMPVPTVNPVPAVNPVNAEGTGEQPAYRPAPERDLQAAREAAKGSRVASAPLAEVADNTGHATSAETVNRNFPPGTAASTGVRTAMPSAAALAANVGSQRAPDATGASLQLSSAGQLVRALLQAPGTAGAPTSTHSPRPLLDGAPMHAETLAIAFARGVAQSGLFYESHLAAWSAQQYPIADLQQEPQAQWSQAAFEGADDGTSAAASDNESPQQAAPLATLPDSALPLLRQQLETLESGRLIWQGDVWPRQPAKLAIADEASRSAAEIPSIWRAQLDVVLPSLGAVRAKFALSGHALQLTLTATEPDSVEMLRAAREPLLAALAAQALDVATLVVRHEPNS